MTDRPNPGAVDRPADSDPNRITANEAAPTTANPQVDPYPGSDTAGPNPATVAAGPNPVGPSPVRPNTVPASEATPSATRESAPAGASPGGPARVGPEPSRDGLTQHHDTTTDRHSKDSNKLSKHSKKVIGKRAFRAFTRDNCTDLAASLTYYSVLALFPALLAMVSLLGLMGQDQKGTDAIVDIVRDIAPGASDSVAEIIAQLNQSGAGTITLIVGLAGALWSASGYVGAFGRALNRIYGVEEGRPFYKLRPWMILITVVIVALVALVAVGLVVSGPVARSIGSAIGMGDTAVTVWNIAKWPVMLGIVILIVALLYWATPNVRRPKFRWLSLGAAIAVLVWIAASAAFGFYIANFSNYNKTYGSLAGVIIFLLWLWITNLALLFGAELDAEIERAHELESGIPAEVTIQLPPRDTKASDKKLAQFDDDVREAKRIRIDSGVPTDEHLRPGQPIGSKDLAAQHQGQPVPPMDQVERSGRSEHPMG